MFNKSRQEMSLQDKRIRYALSIRITTIIVVFFSASWCLLQWSLATEQQYMVDGLTRQFVQLEAIASVVIAVCAFLQLVVNGLGWLATVIKMRRLLASTNAHRSTLQGASPPRIAAFG
jgi:hypothetical protein